MNRPIVVHIDRARTGPEHPEALPPHRILLSCEAKFGYPRCDGAANLGPAYCTCDTLSPEDHARCVSDGVEAFLRRGGGMCDDCAFRAGSPESDRLEEIARSSVPFRCHKGAPVDARSGTPVKDAYVPVLARSATGELEDIGYPICAGWRRANAALTKRTP